MRAQRVTLKGGVARRSDADKYLAAPGDTVIVSRGYPRSVAILCPDGCGERLTINLDPATGPAWRLYRGRRGLTLFPSIWRETGCGSHFIIWNNAIWWCDAEEDWPVRDGPARLEKRVLAHLTSDVFKNVREIADDLDEIPWEVMEACRSLQRKRLIANGSGRLSHSYRLAKRG